MAARTAAMLNLHAYFNCMPISLLQLEFAD
jgi:hypothetical protein